MPEKATILEGAMENKERVSDRNWGSVIPTTFWGWGCKAGGVVLGQCFEIIVYRQAPQRPEGPSGGTFVPENTKKRAKRLRGNQNLPTSFWGHR